ncbi:hypothetical protein IPA_06725 [Ignicoccus pacificus DSM 13166]|uniref:Uncharacterized protein n=1 Tax=Ignicoccus pacificus DSM 13166 TaxID=940294 RepID=A0A977KCR9_9CREN|nr:hypothetical protein IPA_06725 [Ignicoccus pacificus DSM 13166]
MGEVIRKMKELARDDPCIDEVKEIVRKVVKEWKLRCIALIGSLAREGP